MQTSMSHSVLKPVLTLALWLTAVAGLSAEPVVATSKNEVS